MTNSGDITSTGIGINVNVNGKNTTGDNAGIAITHSAGDIAVSGANAQGIKGNIGGEAGSVAAANTGDVRIMVTGGSVQSAGTILEGSHAQAGDVTIEVSEGVTLTSTAQHGIFANIPSANTVADVTIDNAGTITTPKTGLFVRRSASNGNGDISITNSGDIKKTGDTNWDGILVEDLGTGDVTVSNSGNIGDADDMHERGIKVEKQAGAAGGDVTITTTGGSIFAENVGIWVTDTADHTGDVTISNGGDITAERPISVVRNGGGAVSVTNTGGTVRSETLNAIAVRNKTGDASTVTVNVEGGTVRSPGNAIQAFNRGAGDISMTFSGGDDTSLVSEAGVAVYAVLPTAFHAGNQVKAAQGARILGRTGFYANARGYSTADPVEARADGKPNVVDITWTGSFSHGTTDNEDGRFSAPLINNVVFSQETLGGEDATDGVYGGAAGIEAQVMARREIIRQVAMGDDPGAIADNTAQMMAVPNGATADDNAYVAQLRAMLGDPRFNFKVKAETEGDPPTTPVFEAIKSGATSLADLTDADIVTYLQMNDDATRTLLRNILVQGLSEGETAVLKALATGDSAGLTTALNDADAAFSDDYKTAVRALLNRYNTGNIKVAMNGGSIDSRGDGIRAYYATANPNNGAINIAVGLTAIVADGTTTQAASSATVTGARTGIYVANAGAMGTGDDRILKQTVDIYNGTVTGGTDAAVHLVGGGTLRVHEMGTVVAGAGRPAILVNDPGRAEITILGTVEGSEGAAAAVDLSGGGSVTVGPMGRVNTNEGGATSAFKVAGGTYQVAVYAGGTALTKGGVNEAIARVQGGFDTSAADGKIESRPGTGVDGGQQEAQEGQVSYTVVETMGNYRTGRYLPLELEGGDPKTEGNALYAGLDDCPEEGQVLQDNGTCMTPPDPDDPVDPSDPGAGPRDPSKPQTPAAPLPTDCDLSGDRCRLYEALPSTLLALNGLPTYEERMSAARDARGGWARVEVSRGKWKADTSTQPDLAYDHSRSGLRAGMDFAMMGDDAGRVGVSVHGLRGSAEMAGVGEVDLSGAGLGVHVTRALDGGFHVDAQAAVTWYHADLKSTNRDYVAMRPHGTLKNDVNGRGYALGVEVGKRLPGMGGGVTVMPRAGLLWSKVGLDDFTDETNRRVSVKDAQSLKGRAGVGMEKVLDGAGMNGSRLFASLDVEQEFKDETEANVMGSLPLKASARKTRFRAAAGAVHVWGEGRYALQGSLGYAAGGGGNRDLGGGLSLSMKF